MKVETPWLKKDGLDDWATRYTDYVCETFIEKHWHIPKGTKNIKVEISTRETKESVGVIFGHSWNERIIYQRLKTRWGSMFDSAKMLIKKFIKKKGEKKKLFIKVYYK